MKINQISPQESNFTKELGSIVLKHNMLYYYGKIPENSLETVAKSLENGGAKSKKMDEWQQNGLFESTRRPRCVGIVGARKNTTYGKEVAYKVSYELARHGVVVISGLAIGIDSIAHRGALDAGGVTVGVLGTAIERIYPRCHEQLAKEIIQKNGAILSEYREGDQFLKTNFLARNRLIAGLSDVVLVVEAGERSGSLNTAMHALEQGKEVFAVPGDITRSSSVGCNRLIGQGAMPYTGVEDILNLLFPERLAQKKRKIMGDNADETLILQEIINGNTEGEILIEKLSWPPEKFNQIITMLEIKGRVKGLGMNKWMVIR